MEEIIKKFLQVGYGNGNGDGSGSGNGDGSGSGNGDGSGEGYGYGNGYGYGSGEGYGYGNGYGYGDGSGYGDGDGSGDGDGYGYGSGDGDGDGYSSGVSIKTINGRKVYIVDNTPTLIDAVHGNYARGSVLNADLTLTPCYVAKVSNYFAHGDTLKNAFADAVEKYEQNLPVEERIKRFNAQYPDRDKPIPAKELFDWHNKLTGSCLMGRQQWCRDHYIGLDGAYTVNDFISLTRDAYGSDVIRLLEESRP